MKEKKNTRTFSHLFYTRKTGLLSSSLVIDNNAGERNGKRKEFWSKNKILTFSKHTHTHTHGFFPFCWLISYSSFHFQRKTISNAFMNRFLFSSEQNDHGVVVNFRIKSFRSKCVVKWQAKKKNKNKPNKKNDVRIWQFVFLFVSGICKREKPMFASFWNKPIVCLC